MDASPSTLSVNKAVSAKAGRSRAAEIPAALLDWYDAHARVLPWRQPPGSALPAQDRDWPYRVWLSEVMLQQTTVAAVIPYFARFTARWPTVDALAAANEGEVMAAWAGLGYYARARNLIACARAVAAQGGAFPDNEAELRALPGLGAYTAAAVAAIGFGRRAVVVDANVERVVTRLFALSQPLPGAQTSDPCRRRYDHARHARGRFRSGDDGPGRNDLHDAGTALPAVPAAVAMCRASRRAGRCLSGKAAAPRPSGTARSGILDRA